MSSLLNIGNTALKYCNYWALLSNFIIVILCVFFIFYFRYEVRTHTTINAQVLSVKPCTHKYKRTGRHSTIEKYYHCEMVVTYIVNNKKYKNKLITEDINKYYVNQQISIDYLNTDPNIIRHNRGYKYIYYIALFVLLLIIIGSYIRIVHYDNSMVKWWIGFTCMRNIFSSNN